METVSGWGESISHKASASDHQEMVRVMARLLTVFLKTSPKLSAGRGSEAHALLCSCWGLYELNVHIKGG